MFPTSLAPIAQLVEQLPLKEMVPGSNPGGRTSTHAPVAELVYALRLGRSPARVRGSSPLGGTNGRADKKTLIIRVFLLDFYPKSDIIAPRPRYTPLEVFTIEKGRYNMYSTFLTIAVILLIAAAVVGVSTPENSRLSSAIGGLAGRLDSSVRVEHGSVQTLKSFIIGLCVSIGLSAALYIIISVLVELLLPRSLYAGMWLFNPALALGVSIPVGFWLFFPGRFEITPAEIGFAKVFGIPVSGAFRVGSGWLPPKIGELVVESRAGVEFTSTEQKNITADGFSVTWLGSFLLRVTDAIKAQEVTKEDRKKLSMNEFLNAGRDYLAGEEAGVHDALKGELSADEAQNLLATIAQFKIRTHQKGREVIKKAANKKLRKYGLELAEVQIPKTEFSKEVEQAADRILSESLQASGLKKDAQNKAVVHKELMKMYAEAGVDLSTLSPELRAELVDRMASRAMAIEDKEKITRMIFDGQPPRGAMLGLGDMTGGR